MDIPMHTVISGYSRASASSSLPWPVAQKVAPSASSKQPRGVHSWSAEHDQLEQSNCRSSLAGAALALVIAGVARKQRCLRKRLLRKAESVDTEVPSLFDDWKPGKWDMDWEKKWEDDCRATGEYVEFGANLHVREKDRLYKPETAIAEAPSQDWIADVSVEVCSGVADLAERFDAFTLDQYGVLHDGRNAYPGVAETLEQLHAAGKPSVILSNYAGRAATQAAKLPKIGINPETIDAIVTSGELAYRYLTKYQGKLGKMCVWIAWKELEHRGLGDFWDDLPDYKLAKNIEFADFILVSGAETFFAGTEAEVETTFEMDGDIRPFAKTFREAINRSLPMICANPDERVMRPGSNGGEPWKAYLGGSIAKEYERLGGRVIYFGKPYTASFEEARRLLIEAMEQKKDSPVDEEAISICHVGDSLHHDVNGARKVGLNSAFVSHTGLHAEEMEGELTADKVLEVCAENKVLVPQAAISHFKW
eukprot:TRINITY_DN42762_c0_g1_i1.p1 TRINITY_DN42762_c0_g1~~TRINITY_DN42762_c0_g1_i1.p1  ORF type:complete len:497 (-),score=96.71 TRINITY_DN42762_c0_g1_i1:87-1523(-)